MIRRYNYTNRVKLPRKVAHIKTFTDESGAQAFEAEVNFAGYSLPSGAHVYLEAYYGSAMMRFSVGVIGSSSIFHCRGLLTELQDPQVNFRVKVVDEQQSIGRIVALADRIQTLNQDTKQVMRIGLLPVKVTALGDQVWKLEIPSDGTDPVLCVNELLDTGDIPVTELVRNNPIFLTLVFPHVVRRIFEYLLFDREGDYQEEDPEHWGNRWMQYAVKQQGADLPPDRNEDDEKSEWIEQVVERFCKNNHVKNSFEKYVMEMQS
ncbi:hypothetical protein ANRL4_03956 [Anaerolineae bacterium]|nr:hypothetical protein ANRL4_03956 [Anaerolineae bacterium]